MFSKPKRMILENLKKERSSAGVYIILNKNSREIYTGHSANLQHRLFALYYKRSDYAVVKNKSNLVNEAYFYRTRYVQETAARAIEKKRKKKKNGKKLKYNLS